MIWTHARVKVIWIHSCLLVCRVFGLFQKIDALLLAGNRVFVRFWKICPLITGEIALN